VKKLWHRVDPLSLSIKKGGKSGARNNAENHDLAFAQTYWHCLALWSFKYPSSCPLESKALLNTAKWLGFSPSFTQV
jgi:hypothetical protein